jgi:hypothetical protein
VAADGMPMGVLIGVALACLLLGFVVGTRGRRMLAAVRAVASAIAKALAAAMQGQQAESSDAGADAGDNDVEADEGEETKMDLDLNDFLSIEPGLDLHPELEMNPVIMWQLKLAKEEARHDQVIKALQAEGLDEDEINARLMNAEMGGGGGAHIKQSALQVLVENGARTTSTAQGKNAEQAAMDNLRRQRRNVDVFLAKQYGVDTTFAKVDAKQKRVESRDQHVSAAEKAADTGLNPYGGEQLKRSKMVVGMAMQARAQLASWQTKLVREGKLRPAEAYEEHDVQRRDAVGAVESEQLESIRKELGAELESLVADEEGTDGEEDWEDDTEEELNA